MRARDKESRLEGVLERVCCGVEFDCGRRQRREWLRMRARDKKVDQKECWSVHADDDDDDDDVYYRKGRRPREDDDDGKTNCELSTCVTQIESFFTLFLTSEIVHGVYSLNQGHAAREHGHEPRRCSLSSTAQRRTPARSYCGGRLLASSLGPCALCRQWTGE